VHAKDKLAHYARACTDVEFTFPFGTQELLGVAARGNFDLSAHQVRACWCRKWNILAGCVYHLEDVPNIVMFLPTPFIFGR
jgi:hypothetical protein